MVWLWQVLLQHSWSIMAVLSGVNTFQVTLYVVELYN